MPAQAREAWEGSLLKPEEGWAHLFRLLTFLPGRQAWACDPQSGVNAWREGRRHQEKEGSSFYQGPRQSPMWLNKPQTKSAISQEAKTQSNQIEKGRLFHLKNILE